MKTSLQKALIGLLCLSYTHSFAAPPNDDCADATTLMVGTSCSTTAGTTAGSSSTLAACSGVAEDDVWYKFVANATNATITVAGSSSFDAVIQLFEGGCSGTQLYCRDNNYSGISETLSATGLTIGTTYHVRVYEYGNGVPATTTFTICVTSITAPTNDDCSNAITLPVVSNKNTTTANNTTYATQSLSGCSGNADDDVWYKFTANATRDSIYVFGSSFDGVVQVFSGGCSGTSLVCQDNTGTGSAENVYLTGLTVGQTYYIRVFNFWTGGADFVISVYKYGSVVSGTQEVWSTSKLSLYPNPARTELNLDLSAYDSEVSLEIIDAKGNSVMQKSLNAANETMVNVEELENGVYMAKIAAGNRFSTERFVIMK